MDLNDIEERLEKVHLKPAAMEFADPDEVIKEILGETEKEETPEKQKNLRKILNLLRKKTERYTRRKILLMIFL